MKAKKLLSILLCAALLVSTGTFTMQAFAANTKEELDAKRAELWELVLNTPRTNGVVYPPFFTEKRPFLEDGLDYSYASYAALKGPRNAAIDLFGKTTYNYDYVNNSVEPFDLAIAELQAAFDGMEPPNFFEKIYWAVTYVFFGVPMILYALFIMGFYI